MPVVPMSWLSSVTLALRLSSSVFSSGRNDSSLLRFAFSFSRSALPFSSPLIATAFRATSSCSFWVWDAERKAFVSSENRRKRNRRNEKGPRDSDLQLRLELSDLLVFPREFVQQHLHVLRIAAQPVLDWEYLTMNKRRLWKKNSSTSSCGFACLLHVRGLCLT